MKAPLKFIKFASVFAMLIWFSACGNDDEKNNIVQNGGAIYPIWNDKTNISQERIVQKNKSNINRYHSRITFYCT